MPPIEVRSSSADDPRPPGRILIIDDDDLVAGALWRYLAVQGSECDVASDREFAAALMATQRYSVIVVDPYLTGSLAGAPAALLSAIRELQPDAAIVVLTAYGSAELNLPGRARAVETMLPKPQPVVALADLIFETQLRAASPVAQ